MVVTKSLYENEFYTKKIGILLNKLEIPFKNINYYILAFVHRSLINERPDLSKEHNERLEFLGDAVLEMIITHRLYLDFPLNPEGDLTDYRSSIVKGDNLALVSKKLNFNEHLILGKGEEMSGGRKNNYLLANTVEAFLGAIYLDLGYEYAKEFGLKYIYSTLENILNSNSLKDYKSILQEYTQRVFFITPSYEVLSENGLDHEKIYTSGVYLKDTLIGQGSGPSKKKSQLERAKDAYKKRIYNIK